MDATQENAARLARAAADLARALTLLEATKTTRGGVRTARIMRATPRSAMPGNQRAILLSVELDGFLQELCRDLRDTIAPGQLLPSDGAALARWVCDRAEPIAAAIDWCDDLIDALDGYTARTRRAVGLAPGESLNPEPRQYAPAICQQLAEAGYSATPELLVTWHSRSAGAVSVQKRDGKNRYLLSEVIAWITRDRPGPAGPPAPVQGETRR